MTYERFDHVASQVRYKPGWTVECERRAGGLARVHVRGLVLHSATGRPWTIDFYRLFSPRACRTWRDVAERVKLVVFEAEDHEFAEFFRFKGKRLYDPHRAKR